MHTGNRHRILSSLLASLLAGCGSGTAPASPTTAGGITAPTVTATAAVVPSPSTPPPDPTHPPLLVAGPDGITMVSATGVTAVWTGADVAMAVPDGGGGIVFQRFGEEPQAIEWMPGWSPEPVVLVPATGATMLAIDQTWERDGRHHLLYRRSVRLPSDCAAGDDECRWTYDRTYLVLRDLGSGTDRILGAIGAFESSGVRYRIGRDRVAVVVDGYGDLPACVGVTSIDLLAGAAASTNRWIGEGSPLTATCSLGPTAPCGSEAPCDGTAVAALSPDGSTLFAATGYWVGSEPPVLTVYDPDTTDVLGSIPIGPAGHVPTWIDTDGAFVIVGSTDPGGDWDAPGDAVVVTPEGTVIALGRIRSGSWWRATAGQGLDGPPIVVGPDGLGAIRFGTPADTAVADLVTILGVPTSDDTVGAPWPDRWGCAAATGYGCVDHLRFVAWDGAGLRITLLDTPGDPVPHLAAWSVDGPRFPTRAGLTVGATVDELAATYGEALHLPGATDECTGRWWFTIDAAGPDGWPLQGSLSGDPSDAASVVTSLTAGAQSSC